jgi:hypothetical protein
MTPEVSTKIGKLLRMLTSSHDGEVLAAANRLTQSSWLTTSIGIRH